jgi:hypothetical protein
MLTHDEKNVSERLEHWRSRVELVRQMFKQGGGLHEDPETVRSAYASLKQDLKDESRSLKYRRGDPPPTEAEQRWYDRPIRHASAHLIASTNERLTNIRVSVSDAHSDIVLGINRLKQRERE